MSGSEDTGTTADPGEIDERVIALFAMLKNGSIAKAKECAKQVERDARHNVWFEPEQVVEMMHTWLDATVARVDAEVLEHTRGCLRSARVEEESEHPGIVGVIEKLPSAVEVAGSENMDDMLRRRFDAVKLQDTPAIPPIFGPFGQLLMHPKAHLLHEMLTSVTNYKFRDFAERPDTEVAAFCRMTLDYVKHVTKLLPTHKPGNLEVSTVLAHHLQCVDNLLGEAKDICDSLAYKPSGLPETKAALTEPRIVMDLQDALALPKPKPKEHDLKGELKSVRGTCEGLLSAMPRSAVGITAADAHTFVKSLKDIKDAGSLTGVMNQMMSARDQLAVDVVLEKGALGALLAALKRVTKQEYDDVWQTTLDFFIWATERRPAAVEGVADTLLEIYMRSNAFMWQDSRALVDLLAEKSPATARKIWANFDIWVKHLETMEGSQMYPASLYHVSQSLAALPKVLDGPELAAAAKLMVKLAAMSRGGMMEETMKCGAIASLRSVVLKDKSQISTETLKWVEALKSEGGYVRDAAVSFSDAYAGRSLANVYEEVAEMNLRFKAACTDMDSLKRYVDEHVAELKDFVGSIAKKLPVPVRCSAERRLVVNSALLLHFECQAQPKTSCCALPAGTYRTETLEWNKWLKLGLSAAKIGKSVLTADAIGDVGSVVDQAQAMYKLYKKKDDADFVTFISEPFLTSEEQDKLIVQLRKGGFFQNFCYDPQSAGWLCANCHAVYVKTGGVREEATLARAAAELEGSLPLQVGGTLRQGDDLKAQAVLAKDAVVEAQGSTAVCCSFLSICRPATPEQ
mmetsp:Transcript_17067/g.40127  ORF Transcript_17067/g.40127 Transcript_17067/m.40127 type:complete len:799 (-) Transcript_17067:128-2524(-)